MSARVYFMKKMCLCKMNSKDGQVYAVRMLQFSCFTKYNRMQSKHKQTNCKHSKRTSYGYSRCTK